MSCPQTVYPPQSSARPLTGSGAGLATLMARVPQPKIKATVTQMHTNLTKPATAAISCTITQMSVA